MTRAKDELISFDDLKSSIQKQMLLFGLQDDQAQRIVDLVSKEEEKKSGLLNDMIDAVAVYQGQATLGKIVNIVLHEGRRPLNYFKSQVPNITYWAGVYRKSRDAQSLEKIFPILDGIRDNSEALVKLFGRLDPLAAGKRGDKKEVVLVREISKVLDIFHAELTQNGIVISIVGDQELRVACWAQDIYSIFANLVDNSIFWILSKKSNTKAITIEVHATAGRLDYLDYRDSGPGIEPYLIESGVIFEPQFSTKPNGTGLGLAIAGEAAHRNGLELRAIAVPQGAYFRLQPISEERHGNDEDTFA